MSNEGAAAARKAADRFKKTYTGIQFRHKQGKEMQS